MNSSDDIHFEKNEEISAEIPIEAILETTGANFTHGKIPRIVFLVYSDSRLFTPAETNKSTLIKEVSSTLHIQLLFVNNFFSITPCMAYIN